MVASPALVNFLFGHPSAAATPSSVKENPGAGLPSPHSAHQPHFIAICSFQSGSQAKVLLPLSDILKQWRRSQLPSCAVADGFWAASGVLCVCPFASPSEIRTGARAAGCSVSFCFWSSAPPATPFLSWPPGSCLRRCSRRCSCYRTIRSSCPRASLFQTLPLLLRLSASFLSLVVSPVFSWEGCPLDLKDPLMPQPASEIFSLAARADAWAPPWASTLVMLGLLHPPPTSALSLLVTHRPRHNRLGWSHWPSPVTRAWCCTRPLDSRRSWEE